MKITPTSLPDVLLIKPQLYKCVWLFFECFHAKRYGENELNIDFVQGNLAYSEKNILHRLLYVQLEHPPGKGVWVIVDRGLDIAVDS